MQCFGLKHCMNAMMTHGVKGSIVANTSCMGSCPRNSAAGAGIYAAAKAAADMIVKYAAIEGAEAGLASSALQASSLLAMFWPMSDFADQLRDLVWPELLTEPLLSHWPRSLCKRIAHGTSCHVLLASLLSG
jgi:NAD(P)-dependent dehydrogenase (short-subunit alcohol dehydrogenase family)